MTTLVVSAWPPEQRWLRGDDPGSLPGVEFLLTGVGPVRAAAVVAARLGNGPEGGGRTGEPTRVVFVGTAGAYDPVRHAPASVVVSTRAVLTDGGAISRLSYFPGAGESGAFDAWESACDPASDRQDVASAIAGLPVTPCVCPPSITKDPTLAALLARLGGVENLELAGVAAACALRGLPWRAFLGVSNAVGPGAHAEWRSLHERASEEAGRRAAEFLRALGRAVAPSGQGTS